MGTGRHWDAEVASVMVASVMVASVMVASRIVESCGMDARGMIVWRPNREVGGNRTPGEIEGGVQNGWALGIGRQVRLDAASRIMESCKMDARGMIVWRPNREERGNRTPCGCECGVQIEKREEIGRRVDANAASK